MTKFHEHAIRIRMRTRPIDGFTRYTGCFKQQVMPWPRREEERATAIVDEATTPHKALREFRAGNTADNARAG